MEHPEQRERPFLYMYYITPAGLSVLGTAYISHRCHVNPGRSLVCTRSRLFKHKVGELRELLLQSYLYLAKQSARFN